MTTAIWSTALGGRDLANFLMGKRRSMNASTENESSIVKILLIALALNFLAALSHGQESAAQWLEDAKAAFDTRDAGLFESSSKEEDRYRFRTAMLRNIEKTGPYFHDGSVTTLSEAVECPNGSKPVTF